MKKTLRPFLWGIFSVSVLVILMAVAWKKYEVFLFQGSQPSHSAKAVGAMETKGIPEFEFEDLYGKKLSIEEYKGKLIIVNFWASWCNPCIEEFPSLLRLIEEMKGELILVALSADSSEEEARKFLSLFKFNPNWVKVGWDRNMEIAQMFGTEVLPESYIVGKDFRLKRKIIGVENWSSPQALEFFKYLALKKD